MMKYANLIYFSGFFLFFLFPVPFGYNVEAALDIGKNGQDNVKDLTIFLPRNHVKDGTVDYTKHIQRGIDTYLSVTMPNFPILVNPDGLKMRSGSSLYFQPNSKILVKPNDLVGYTALLVNKVSNVQIINPTIIGDRDSHFGSKGEWGMGIRIIDSKNVTIRNGHISKCWGDGIYIGDDVSNMIVNENINIVGGVIDSNRRNGITVISGVNVNISDVKITNSNGTMPMSGIDIEPNSPKNRLSNVNIQNATTSTKGSGLIVSLYALMGSNQEVSIYINNHKDNGSYHGFYIGRLDNGFSNLNGKIINSDSKYSNNVCNGVILEGYTAINTPQIVINSVEIYNPNNSNQKSPRWGSGIVFLRDARKKSKDVLGNLTINNAKIVDNRTVKKINSGFHFIDDMKAGFKNTSISGKVSFHGFESTKFFNVVGNGVSIRHN